MRSVLKIGCLCMILLARVKAPNHLATRDTLYLHHHVSTEPTVADIGADGQLARSYTTK